MTDRTEQNAVVKISEDGVKIIGTVPVSFAIPTDIVISGTHTFITVLQEVLESSGKTLIDGVILKADDDNAHDVWVGGSSVAPNNGMRLGPGESLPIAVSDGGKVYLRGWIGEKVHYIGG